MKKIFVLALIIIAAGLIFPKTTDAEMLYKTASAQLVVNADNISSDDIRVAALKRVFEKYDSPLVQVADSYVELADKNGIDWKLLPAISGLESSFGKRLMPNSYNAYGWGGGYIYFESWEDGIDTITKALSEKYYGRGADNVWKIGPIYAESPTWAVRVNSFMKSIEKEYVSLLRDEVTITI